MLQRAANNTYSWWWASHIRTKHSKWMEQSLQDMEEKVTVVLKLLEEDGDTFARRAEMYYKKRPELINFVQESYRAYRALAERYDHLSTELQNAHSTIASCFPEQLPFSIEDEDEFGSPKFLKKAPDNARGNFPIVPKVPKPPVNRDSKGLATSGINRKQHKITSPRVSIDVNPKSGLSKIEGTNEIHRLQKRILALQTEKEFARSTYESAMGMYWELDREIHEIHEKLCGLEDEFGEGKAIADDEARIIMEVTALKSCRDTLAQLQEKQARSAAEARVEKKRIKVSKEKLDALKNKFQLIQEECTRVEQEMDDHDNDNDDIQKRREIESLKEKIKQQFEDFFGGSLSVAEMEAKIDELVNNVISLKSLVASQTVLVHRLRTEIDMFEAQIQVVEDDEVAMIDVKKKIREMEEKLHEIEDLSKSFEDQNNYLQTHFTEASCNLGHLSEKVQSMIEKLQKEKTSSVGLKSFKEIKEGMVKQGMLLQYNSLPKTELEEQENSNGFNHHDGSGDAELVGNEKDNVEEIESVATSNRSYIEGIENKEKNLLMQYSSMLRNYKDTQKSKKLMEVEANNQDNRMTEIMSQLKELEKRNTMKDELIRSLKEKIGLFQKGFGEPIETQPAEKEVEQDIDAMMLIEKPGTTSKIEDKSRADTDATMLVEKPGTTSKIEDKSRADTDAMMLMEKPGTTSKIEDKSRADTDAMMLIEKPGTTSGIDDKFRADTDATMLIEKPRTTSEIKDISRADIDAMMLMEKPGTTSKVEDKSRADTDAMMLMEKPGTTSEIEDKSREDIDAMKLMEKPRTTSKMEDKSRADTDAMMVIEKPGTTSEIEDKFREDIDPMMLIEKPETASKIEDNSREDTDAMMLIEKLGTTSEIEDKSQADTEAMMLMVKSGTTSEIEDKSQADTNVTMLMEKSGITSEIEDKFQANIDAMMLIVKPGTTSEVEDKFRADIDELLEENLDFWFRFSSTFQEVNKFKGRVKDLSEEVSEIEERRKQSGGSSSSLDYSLRSDMLKEVHNELTVWMGKGELLKDELKDRFSSLCEIQEEMTRAVKESAEDEEFKFTSLQAAKLQGEILNMKQENAKVAKEVQAGLDNVRKLQLDIERSQARLRGDTGVSRSKDQQKGENGKVRHLKRGPGVPLSAFILDGKPKKQKTSIFHRMNTGFIRSVKSCKY